MTDRTIDITPLRSKRNTIDWWSECNFRANRHPWFCHVELTPDTWKKAIAIDGDGYRMIAETEGR